MLDVRAGLDTKAGVDRAISEVISSIPESASSGIMGDRWLVQSLRTNATQSRGNSLAPIFLIDGFKNGLRLNPSRHELIIILEKPVRDDMLNADLTRAMRNMGVIRKNPTSDQAYTQDSARLSLESSGFKRTSWPREMVIILSPDNITGNFTPIVILEAYLLHSLDRQKAALTS